MMPARRLVDIPRRECRTAKIDRAMASWHIRTEAKAADERFASLQTQMLGMKPTKEGLFPARHKVSGQAGPYRRQKFAPCLGSNVNPPAKTTLGSVGSASSSRN